MIDSIDHVSDQILSIMNELYNQAKAIYNNYECGKPFTLNHWISELSNIYAKLQLLHHNQIEVFNRTYVLGKKYRVACKSISTWLNYLECERMNRKIEKKGL